MSAYAGPVCRGCWALGTACGRCERCRATAPKEMASPPIFRAEVSAMAALMEAKLRENDAKKGKAGWKGEDPQWLHQMLLTETEELLEAILQFEASPNDDALRLAAVREAADVANFAMMIADRLGGIG